MFKLKYALESDGPVRLEVRWNGGRYYPEKDITILLDGALIGVIPDWAMLKAGQEFILPDQSVLQVKLVNREIGVFRNGISLAEIYHPEGVVKDTSGFFSFIGFMEIGLAVLAFFKILLPDTSLPTTLTLFICGVLFLVLGRLARRKVMLAFILSGVLYVIQFLIFLFLEHDYSFGAILLVVLAIIYAVEGIRAIKKLSNQRIGGKK